MDVDLRHLRVVLIVAESGSISRAAVRLKIAQSGLTAQLRRIEEAFGGPLFRRRPDGVVPTELGAYVLDRARQLLDEFGTLLSTAQALHQSDDPPGAVALGGVDNPWLPVIAGIVRNRLPHHEQLTYLEPDSASVLEMLRTEKIALAVLSEFRDVAPPVHEFPARDLGTEPVLVGLAPGHRLANRHTIDLEELAEEAWVTPSERSDGLGLSLRAACARAGFTPRFRHFTPDQATAAALVGADHAVGVFSLPRPGSHPPGIVLKRMAGGQLWRRTWLVWTAASALAGLAEDICADALGRRPQGW